MFGKTPKHCHFCSSACQPVAKPILLALTQALGGLPLAPEQACAYINETGISISSYLQRLQEPLRAWALLDKTASQLCSRSVFGTLTLAFDKLSPAAKDVLGICACCDTFLNCTLRLNRAGFDKMNSFQRKGVHMLALLRQLAIGLLAFSSFSNRLLVPVVSRDFFAFLRIVRTPADFAVLDKTSLSPKVQRFIWLEFYDALCRVFKFNLKRRAKFDKWLPPASNFMITNVMVKADKKPCGKHEWWDE